MFGKVNEDYAKVNDMLILILKQFIVNKLFHGERITLDALISFHVFIS